MKQSNAKSCGVSIAASMAASVLISVPVDSVSAQTTCPKPSNVVLLPGYSITAVACGLNFPTAMTFQDDTIWVTEEGTATSPPAVKTVDNMGNVTTMLSAAQLPTGSLVSPLTGHRVRWWLVLFGTPPDELQNRPWSAGRRGFAIPGKQSGCDISNLNRRLSIFWRSSELTDRLRCQWPRLHQWGRADQLQRRRA
jgi:hypothetical protein